MVWSTWTGPSAVDAVLDCWLGGQAGGSAAVDVLLGEVEPGGRLAESIPVHVAQLPAHRNFPGEPRQVEYREGLYVGYRFHDTAGVPARLPSAMVCRTRPSTGLGSPSRRPDQARRRRRISRCG